MFIHIFTENHSNVVLLGADEDAKLSSSFSGKSIDYLLVSAFKTPGNNNLYLKQELVKLLRLAADGKINTLEFENMFVKLSEVIPHLNEDDPIIKLIEELRVARKEILQ